MNEEALRELLHSAADRGGASLLDDVAAADAVLDARRTQRRQWAGTAAAAACAALILVLVSVLIGDRPPGDAEPAAPVLEWPARGSLADDPAAVEAVRTLPWSIDELVNPDDRSVPFIGDVPGGRRALVVGPPAGDRGWDTFYGQWFTGPAGVDPADLVADSPVLGLGELESVSALSHDGSGLVVLAAPGDTVEVSPRVVVGTDGSVRRDFTTAETVDGVAMAEVDSTTAHGPAAIYRVRRDGVVVDRGRPFQPLGLLEDSDPPELPPLFPSPAPPVPDAVALAISQVAAEVGEDEEDLRPELLWAGPISGSEGGADVVVLAVTLPNGAVVVSTAWARTGPEGLDSGGVCGGQSHPAGTPVDSLAVAVRCRIGEAGRGSGEPVLLIVTPGTIARAVLMSADGTTSTSHEVGAGAFTMAPPAPGADRVRFEGPSVGPVEQAVVDSPELQIVDREGRRAER